MDRLGMKRSLLELVRGLRTCLLGVAESRRIDFWGVDIGRRAGDIETLLTPEATGTCFFLRLGLFAAFATSCAVRVDKGVGGK